MLLLLKSLSGLSSPLLLLLLVLISIPSCSKVGALGLLTGGGTNVAANTQIGKTNNQTIGTTQTVAPSVSVRPNARVDNIDQSVTDTKVSTDRVESLTINEIPPWVILFALIGWLLPTPAQMASSIANFVLLLFRKNRS